MQTIESFSYKTTIYRVNRYRQKASYEEFTVLAI